jgi:hypothetical protein
LFVVSHINHSPQTEHTHMAKKAAKKKAAKKPAAKKKTAAKKKK